MIKLVYCLRRIPELSREEFQRYWREKHGALVRDRAAALGIQRYVQVHALDSPLNEAMRASRGSDPDIFDGVAELWWESPDAFSAGARTDEGRKAARELYEDEKRFIDFSRSLAFVAQEHPFVGD
ncbi:MAG: EthD family reductase [Chloroflexi bacterium]|nr:MAG: EthD family reductase [Chloroflexota bacterium]